MRTIYIDLNFKCHSFNDGTMTAIETDFFDGKCDTFIEGHCCEIRETCVKIYPWKPYPELKAAQMQYEQDMTDLAAAYAEGVNSV